MVHARLHDRALMSAYALKAEIANTRILLAALRMRTALVKANFDPKQPRVPAGTSEGGQWTHDAGGAARVADIDPEIRLAEPEQELPVVLISDDGSQRPEGPPNIPKEPPAKPRDRNELLEIPLSGQECSVGRPARSACSSAISKRRG